MKRLIIALALALMCIQGTGAQTSARQPIYITTGIFIASIEEGALTLKDRRMQQATTMGLDITRAEFLAALDRASQFVPKQGAAILVFERGGSVD